MVTRRALVTGISGQDGSYLAEQLLAEGTQVHALHHAAEEPPTHCPAGVVLHRGDVTDHAATAALLAEVEPHEVYHLAGLSSVAGSWAEPERTLAVNGVAAVALMESALALQERVGRPVAFVQASSAEIFGDPDRSPQDEHTSVRPTHPYGVAKATAHQWVGLVRGRGLHAVSAVLYNHESPRRPETFVTRRVTAGVAAIALGRARRLSLGSLDVRRDWGWAPDHVAAMVLAARHPEPQDYVVATGRSHSVRDLVATAFAAAGVEEWEHLVDTDPARVRPVDAAELVGDPTRAETVLGWRRTHDFSGIVGAMVEADLARLDAR